MSEQEIVAALLEIRDDPKSKLAWPDIDFIDGIGILGFAKASGYHYGDEREYQNRRARQLLRIHRGICL